MLTLTLTKKNARKDEADDNAAKEHSCL